MERIYDVGHLIVWRDCAAECLLFEWFGIAPTGEKLRQQFEQALAVWNVERRGAAADRPWTCLIDLQHLLISDLADMQWLTDTWGPALLRAGARQPLFVLTAQQLAVAAPRTPCAHVQPADDEPLTAPALFSDPARAQFQLRRRARRTDAKIRV